MPRPLGRIYAPDPRDANYLMARKLPQPPDHPTGKRLHDIPVRYNQGDTEACTGYSAATAETGRIANLNGPIVGFDAMGIYNWANANDGDPTAHQGSTVRAAFQGMVSVGADVAYSGARANRYPVGDAVKANQFLWADLTDVEAALDHLTSWLLIVGPVVIGITWYNSMFCEDDNGNFTAPTGGYIQIGQGGVAGGHAICIRGVNADDPQHPFVLRNSWQPWGIAVEPDWSVNLAHGDGGDILISRDDLGTLLADQGEAGALVTDVDAIEVPATAAPAPTTDEEVIGS